MAKDNCRDCTCHLKICEAECCKEFTITFNEDPLEFKGRKIVSIRKELSTSMAWYYRLHNCDYTRGVLRVPLRNAEFVGNKIIFRERCKLLTKDNLCKTHPVKPEICKELTWETAKMEGKTFYLTPRCLFKRDI
jgi:Fe-S-cluster containining protein